MFAILLSSNYWQQAVFLHNSEYGLGIVMDTVTLQPDMHTTIAIGLAALLLAFSYFLCHLWLHFLSVIERKSRNNSFSIFIRLFSYLFSCSVSAGLRPRRFGTPRISFCLSRCSRSLITFLFANPNFYAISLCVLPCSIFPRMIGNTSHTFLCFLGIVTPLW